MIFLTLSATVAWTRPSITVRASGEGAWVSTDKAVYSPEQTVTISGGGFEPLTGVIVTVERPDGHVDTVFAPTDDAGNFMCTYQLDGITGDYTVVATDGSSTASTTFNDPATYSIAITTISGSSGSTPPLTNPIHLAGTASVGPNFPGQLSQYQVQVDWGDGTVDPDSALSFVQSGTSFSGTWSSSPDHSYATGGTYTIIVKLYHGQPPGAESGDNQASATIQVAPASFLVHYVATGNANPITVPADEWVNSGSPATGVFPSPVTVDGTKDTFVSDNRPLTITAPTTITGTYQTSYYLTVSSAHGTTSGEGWYNSGATAYAGVSPLTVPGGSGVQYVFTGWSGGASGTTSPSDPITMDGPKTATANWKTQFYLTVTSAHGTTGGEGWYDENTNAYATLDAGIVPGGPGVQYVFTGWGVDATGTGLTSDPIFMDGPMTAEANWQTQFYLTVVVDPLGFTTIPGEGWYNEGANPLLTAPGVWGYKVSWDVDGNPVAGNPIYVLMNAPHTATAHYRKLVTRSQGFWATHYEFTKAVWALVADKTIGTKVVNTDGKLFGAFWSNIPYKSDGKTKRTALDQARMQLLQQLVAAILNVQEFGDDSLGTGASLIAAGKAAFAGTDRAAIISAAGALAGFNSWGDGEPLPVGVIPGSANPQKAQSMASKPFWDTLP
jgi:uncharacterized repeat protein (TIGR02543 family)